MQTAHIRTRAADAAPSTGQRTYFVRTLFSVSCVTLAHQRLQVQRREGSRKSLASIKDH